MSKTGLTILLFIVTTSNLFAEQRSVTATGRAVISDGITLRQAKHQALNQARSLAVEKAAGVSVNSALLMQNALVVSEFVKTFSHGFLVKEELLGWQGEWVKTKNHELLGLPVVTVSIKAQVEIPQNSFFHNYSLEAKLNKQIFSSGEQVKLDIQAREKILILVLNYTSDNKIIPIFPFDKNSQTILDKNAHLELPGKHSESFSITVNNYPEHKKDTEAFIILGIPANKDTIEIPWFKLFKRGEEISYPAFFAVLLELPIPWLAEKTLVYSVYSE